MNFKLFAYLLSLVLQKSGSCNYVTDLNICIRASNDYLMSNATKLGLKEAPFDMKYIASHLNKNTDLKSIKIKKTFRHRLNVMDFFDSEGRIPCTLLFDYNLALEASLLVQEYARLDKRVGPFIYAVKWFVKSRDILLSVKKKQIPKETNTNISVCKEYEGYLRLHAYIVMALYFFKGSVRRSSYSQLAKFTRLMLHVQLLLAFR